MNAANRSSAASANQAHPHPGRSSLVAASMPWAFTQRHPLSTDEFIHEADRRGADLDLSTLRELYRHKLLIPFVAISDRRVGSPAPPSEPEPSAMGTRLTELRAARDSGRMQDLAEIPFRPRLPFEQGHKPPHLWWNGLLYSWYQLLILPRLQAILSQCRRRYSEERLMALLPAPDSFLVGDGARFRRIAIATTALEARYLPVLEDHGWIQLINAQPDEWRQYRDRFDATTVCERLTYTAAAAREDAEWLLVLAHSIDPVGSSWSQLMRWAPRDSRKELKNAALSAVDLREAAEVLLLFYQDLTSQGQAEPLPADVGQWRGWHPLQERLIHRPRSLDQELMQLGISPHPRVVLAVEGDTEEIHVPKVWKSLNYPKAPELVRILNLGGADHDLQKVAVLAAAPLVGERAEGQDFWWLIKPPTQLLVAVDPDQRYSTPEKVVAVRTKVLNEIKEVLKAQGAKTADEELDQLVEIRTWSERCYEFAHFTDEELADGIVAIHDTINGITREELVASLAKHRKQRKDVKEVWSLWDYKPSKRKLAEALWPVLEQKIERARLDSTAPVPEIVEVVQQAYLIAQRWRYRTFVLKAVD